jgi:hypothetical protein
MSSARTRLSSSAALLLACAALLTVESRVLPRYPTSFHLQQAAVHLELPHADRASRTTTTSAPLWTGLLSALSLLRSPSTPGVTVLDTGEPPDLYRSGGIAWQGQQLALRFTPAAAGDVQSVTLWLDARRCSTRSQVLLALCEDQGGAGPADACVDAAEVFTLPPRVAQVEWKPRSAPRVELDRLYWLVVAGDAAADATSVTWLDGAVGAPAAAEPRNAGACVNPRGRGVCQRRWRAAERRHLTGPREDGFAHPAGTSRTNLAWSAFHACSC